MRRNKIIRWFFNRLYKIRLPEFVQYWKTGDKARAKLTTLKDGSYAMFIEGEKYPLYGFPRGPVLYGPLMRLKHMGKNLIFNKAWEMLEEGKSNEEVMAYIRNAALPIVMEEINKSRYDFFPFERLCPAVKEIWRALTAIEERLEDPIAKKQFNILKQGGTFFLQEDDAYRFRLQWAAGFINPNSIWRKIYRFITKKPYSLKKELEFFFKFIENAEITPDMKGRIRLIYRILLLFLENDEFGPLIEKIMWEIDWNKLKLSKSDTYYFRGKYFKVDYANFDY